MNEQKKKIMWKVSFVSVSVGLIIIFILYIISDEKKRAERNQIEISKIVGRFDILEKFYMFDNRKHGGIGKVLQDRINKDCYLYVTKGRGRSRTEAITKIDCPLK